MKWRKYANNLYYAFWAVLVISWIALLFDQTIAFGVVAVITLFICLFCVLYIVIVGELFVTHWEMTEKECEQRETGYGEGSYQSFKRELHKRADEWEYKSRFDNSLFVYDMVGDNDSMIHAGVILFDGEGMILSPLDYFLAKRYFLRYIEENFKQVEEGKGATYTENLWK